MRIGLSRPTEIEAGPLAPCWFGSTAGPCGKLGFDQCVRRSPLAGSSSPQQTESAQKSWFRTSACTALARIQTAMGGRVNCRWFPSPATSDSWLPVEPLAGSFCLRPLPSLKARMAARSPWSWALIPSGAPAAGVSTTRSVSERRISVGTAHSLAISFHRRPGPRPVNGLIGLLDLGIRGVGLSLVADLYTLHQVGLMDEVCHLFLDARMLSWQKQSQEWCASKP